ncbi:MAG: SGNH/GDSL hydrolase family protein [Alphaproteobacteria bacterium]
MNIRNRISSALFLAAAAAIPWHAGAMARTMVVVGDSLSAGYLNGSLYEKQQAHGYASVVAKQAHINLPLPLLAEPGIPSVLKLKGGTGEISRDPGASTGRIDPTELVYNLAVPGATAYHALALEPDFTAAPMTRVQGMTNLILGLPGVFIEEVHSQVAWAYGLDPDIVLVWVGGQDALLGVINGTDAAATDADRFALHFATIMDTLAVTGAKIIVANVPSVADIPFVLSRAEAAAFLGLDEVTLGFLGITPTDSVTFDSLSPIASALQGDPTEFALRSLETCFVAEGANVADANPDTTCDDYVLTAVEMTAIEAKVVAYNTAIDDFLVDFSGNATLVDMHGFFADATTYGILVDGHQWLSTDFLGGVFSLDGIHPAYMAQALIADEFIAAINVAFEGEVVPPLSRQQIRGILKSDPLVVKLPGNSPPPMGPVFALGEGDTVFGLIGPGAPEPK